MSDRLFFSIIALVGLASSGFSAERVESGKSRAIDFNRDVKPILAEHCAHKYDDKYLLAGEQQGHCLVGVNPSKGGAIYNLAPLPPLGRARGAPVRRARGWGEHFWGPGPGWTWDFGRG